jgi:hypothetical protein
MRASQNTGDQADGDLAVALEHVQELVPGHAGDTTIGHRHD